MKREALVYCAGCGIVERLWRQLDGAGRCEPCQREAARGANMTPAREPGRPEEPLRKGGKRPRRYRPPARR